MEAILKLIIFLLVLGIIIVVGCISTDNIIKKRKMTKIKRAASSDAVYDYVNRRVGNKESICIYCDNSPESSIISHYINREGCNKFE